MEYSLLAILYFFRDLLNLLLDMEVIAGISVGGIMFSVMIFSAIFVGLGISKSIAGIFVNKKE